MNLYLSYLVVWQLQALHHAALGGSISNIEMRILRLHSLHEQYVC